MPDDSPDLPDELDDLAAAFARGECDDEGLRRLLERLRADGGRGVDAARRVWQALALATDLRASLDPRVADAVRLRLEGGGGFVRDARLRLGVAPPALQPVTAPSVPPPRRRTGRWLVALVIIVVLAVVTWWLLRPGPVAVVMAVSGRATLSGTPLVVGDRIDGRNLVLGAGAGLELALVDGGRIRLAGPAAAVLQPRGLALIAGRAWLHAVQPLHVGLPNGRLVAAAGAVVAAEAQEMSGVMAVEAGTAASDDGRIVVAGSACIGERLFPWRPSLPVAADGGLAIPAGFPAFDVMAEVRFASDDARLRLRLDEGSDLVLADRRWSEVPAGADPASWTPLAGLPPSTLRIEACFRHPRLTVRVDGVVIATQDRPRAAFALVPGPGITLSTKGRSGPEREP